MELLRRIARCFGEPFADSSAVPTFYVSERASREVKMVLSGDGGDELFGGYDSYAAVVRRLSAADRSAAGGLRAAMARWMRPAPARGVQRLHDGSRTLFSDAQIRALLPGIELPDRVRPPAAALPGEGALTRFQAEDFKLYLHDDVLTKVDRMSMANSLEVRVPLLDHELVELAFSVPENLKVRADAGTVTTKYLLKRSAERFLPCDLLHRRKQGFGVPIAKWFSGALVGDLRARFEDPGNPVFGIVDRKGALDVLRPVLSGAPTGSPASAWALLMLDLWFHEVHRARRHATA
jgi:asparagine synthase (glutamine-hydrolysing)